MQGGSYNKIFHTPEGVISCTLYVFFSRWQLDGKRYCSDLRNRYIKKAERELLKG